MINFAVGPVQSPEAVCRIGGEQVPYFRTAEFSALMKESEVWMRTLAKAPDRSHVIFLTGSGTMAMEAAVANTLTKADKALVINGGSFGERFVELCEVYEIPFDQIKLDFGRTLKEEDLCPYDGKGYTAFLVNVGETSSGILYDMDMISDFCKKNGLFLICDCISSFLADPFDMEKLGANIMITGSQKALACAPGVSILVLDEIALEKISKANVHSIYLDLQRALSNMDRGQTPFTPAVGILIQIHERLKQIIEDGGVEEENKRHKERAEYFRKRIRELAFEPVAQTPSNAVTSLRPLKGKATEIFETLKNEYGIWICPNGGVWKDSVFRVGHLGDLKEKDYDTLMDALKDLERRGIC